MAKKKFRKKGISIVKNARFAIPILTLVLVPATETLPAQPWGQEVCVVTITGQNKNRTIDGAVNVECGDECYGPGLCHTAPFGNWGVYSNYGDITDTDQFKGWKVPPFPDSKEQWNSCTTSVAEYWSPNCDFYNANSCTTQSSSATVTHGALTYRQSPRACLAPGITPPPDYYVGCTQEGGTVSQTSNYMTLYELDFDGNDYVTKLSFPATSVTLTCDYDGCSRKTTTWKDDDGSTHPATGVDAKLRMTVDARLEGSCDWNW